MARQRVILVDGSSLVFRAFFAIPSNFQTSHGVPTNATYGFALMFRRILAGRQPTLGAVVFDAPGKTFRDEKYPKYKAQRPPMMRELREQIPWIKKVVGAHDFPQTSVSGYEADDVIGTLTRQALEEGHEVYIVSGDKDFAQLIGPHVRMVDTMKDVTYDAELVRKKWGVAPNMFVEYLALVGDKADNIPGVPGVGPKTAKKLLERFGDLDTIRASTGELKGKQKERLEEHADDARLSRELATIDCHVPLDELGLTLSDLEIPTVDRSKVDALYRELEFFSLLSGSDAAERAADADYEALSIDEAEAFFQELGRDAPVAIRVLYEGSAAHAVPVGVAFAGTSQRGRARYLPLTESKRALPLLKTWAENAERHKIAHGARTQCCVLMAWGIDLQGVVGDTQVGSFLCDPTKDIPHRLDQVARSWLHRTVLTLQSVVSPKGKTARGKVRLTDVPVEQLIPYACQHVAAIAEAWPKIASVVEERGQLRYLEEISLPLAKVLARMQRVGISADPSVLDTLGTEFEKRKTEVEADIYALAGRDFNIGSPKQLGVVLFDELELPVIKRTKTGYSTAADVLNRLAPKHAIAQRILDWRALAKLINTYTRVLREAIHPESGRVHCTFEQTVGASGRLITTDPDLQRTPIRTDDGKRIREAFVACPDRQDEWVMISADWSQIELRIVAHVSEDEMLIDSFRNGVDVHRRTAGAIFDVAPEDVSSAQRNVGKTVNFATIYGQGATALGQNLGVPRAEASDMIDAYFEAYAGVREWLDEIVMDAYQRGYVETLCGRRRYIPELSSNNVVDRSYGERIATNTPIQGSGADICKLAMLAIDRRLREEGRQTRMLLQIHDELVFEAPVDELEAAEALIRECMEGAFPELCVPLVVDIGHGNSWATAH